MPLPESASQPVLYHLHIPKTAGTTVHGMIRSHFEDERVASTNPLQVLQFTPEQWKQHDFFGGHLEFGYYLPQLTGREVHSVVFIRDPRKILLSMFKHVRGAKRDPLKPYVEANCPTLIQYLHDPMMSRYIHNPQTRYLGVSERKITPAYIDKIRQAADPEEVQRIIHEANVAIAQVPEQQIIETAHARLRECTIVGIVDNLDESLCRVCDLRGWPMYQEIRSRNVSPVKVDPLSELPREVVDRLDELTQWDRKLYDAAIELFNEQSERYPMGNSTSVAVPQLPSAEFAACPSATAEPSIKLAKLPSEADRPLRVGIWCWYNVTLEPSEGIGVFSHHLAKGLAALPDGPDVFLFTKPGEQHMVSETVEAGNGRIRAISCGRPPKLKRQLSKIGKIFAGPAKTVRDFCNKHQQKGRKRSPYSIFRSLLPFSEKFRRTRIGRALNVLLAVVASPLVLIAFVLNRLYCALLNEVHDLAASIHAKCASWLTSFENNQEEQVQSLMRRCDVWVIPYVGLNREFPTATVVTIHDLVGYHFPEVLPPNRLQRVKDLVNKVAHQSTVGACLSEFIRDNDLYGQLKLPPEKVRVVKPGMQDNFGEMCSEAEATSSKPLLNKKYIFYPAAFRAYKNHEALVEAMHVLRERGREDLHVVFTGMSDAPEKIKALIEKYGLHDRVHVLKKVSRQELALLYHKALATIVPSLYEQGSFPLVEALHWNCPVAASDIPALKEQFAPLGDSMLYFGTHNYAELADVIERIDANREEIRQAQQLGRIEMSKRTWVDAAGDWMDVFRYAIQLHREQRAAERRKARARHVA